MAVLRAKDVAKMDLKSRINKMKELKLELAKSKVTAQKSSGKTKEIKKAIARIFTFNASEKSGTLKKK